MKALSIVCVLVALAGCANPLMHPQSNIPEGYASFGCVRYDGHLNGTFTALQGKGFDCHASGDALEGAIINFEIEGGSIVIDKRVPIMPLEEFQQGPQLAPPGRSL